MPEITKIELVQEGDVADKKQAQVKVTETVEKARFVTENQILQDIAHYQNLKTIAIADYDAKIAKSEALLIEIRNATKDIIEVAPVEEVAI